MAKLNENIKKPGSFVEVGRRHPPRIKLVLAGGRRWVSGVGWVGE